MPSHKPTVAAEHFDMVYQVERFPELIDAETISVVTFKEDVAKLQFPPDLFDEITERHTNRSAYDGRMDSHCEYCHQTWSPKNTQAL